MDEGLPDEEISEVAYVLDEDAEEIIDVSRSNEDDDDNDEYDGTGNDNDDDDNDNDDAGE